MLVVWHLLALAVDAGLIGAVLIRRWSLGGGLNTVQHFAVLVMGAALAVTSLTAAWLALGPLAIAVRMAVAPLVCLVVLFAATLPLAATGANPAAVMGLFLAGIAQFLLLQVPFWLIRSWHRLRVVALGELGGRGSMERLQYSLWQMLVVMTLIAMALGIGRGIIALVGHSSPGPGFVVVLSSFFAMLVGYNLLLAWPLVWAVLSPIRMARKIAWAIGLTILVVIVAYPLTTAILGPGEGAWIYWLIFVPQPAYLLAHLFATRAGGYRLVQLV